MKIAQNENNLSDLQLQLNKYVGIINYIANKYITMCIVILCIVLLIFKRNYKTKNTKMRIVD